MHFNHISISNISIIFSKLKLNLTFLNFVIWSATNCVIQLYFFKILEYQLILTESLQIIIFVLTFLVFT